MEALGPCTMVGRYVELVPLRASHVEALLQAGAGVDWRWMAGAMDTAKNAQDWIKRTKAAEERGEEYAFAVKVRPGRGLPRPGTSGGIIGSTRYMDVVPEHKGAEIGGTWYSPAFQGTVVNPECKYLLLEHAFEGWGAIRVQIKTDVNNLPSQRAISKLGARFEGRLRNHRIRRDGTYRDTMMYSITAEEWPAVKSGLKERIDAWVPEKRGSD